jgi:hypothetical protein|eukprot:COSAG01_NODE_1140_length_11537_cov_73.353995_5_plen_123_part_00
MPAVAAATGGEATGASADSQVCGPPRPVPSGNVGTAGSAVWAECPVCNKRLPLAFMSAHLDLECSGRGGAAATTEAVAQAHGGGGTGSTSESPQTRSSSAGAPPSAHAQTQELLTVRHSAIY